MEARLSRQTGPSAVSMRRARPGAGIHAKDMPKDPEAVSVLPT